MADWDYLFSISEKYFSNQKIKLSVTEISDATIVQEGKAWKMTKAFAMKDNYKSMEFYIKLGDEGKELVEQLRMAQLKLGDPKAKLPVTQLEAEIEEETKEEKKE